MYHFLIEGRPVVEWFIEDKKQRLKDKEAAWLSAQQAAWLSLWEVQSGSSGKRIALKDLLTGEERTVTETKGSYNIKRRDVICARVVDFDGISLMAGSHPRFLSPLHAAEVLERIKTRLRRKRYVPLDRMRDEKLGRFMIEQWENKVEDADTAASVMPALHNMDGDALLLTVDHFQLSNENPAEITAKLAALEDAQLDERDRSIFFVREPTNQRGVETVTVGRARIENGKLSVETNSIERADALRDRLESVLGDDLRHITRTHVDPERALDDLSESDAPDTSLSSEEADAAVLAYKERFYATWPEFPIPMLDGKTPKQAVRTKGGREQVDLLLRDFENTEERQPAAQRYDFSKLRRVLKLDA